jgi:putative addiction module killer protein
MIGIPDVQNFPLDILYPIEYTVNMIEIRETETFKTWMRNLRDKVTRAIINARIRRISGGNFGNVSPVGEGVSELRIPYGPGFRVYFKQINEVIVVLLCGGDKSSQSKDIENAKLLAKNLEGIV